jgi:hypothetical protein
VKFEGGDPVVEEVTIDQVKKALGVENV